MAVARTGSFRKAAGELYLSQPAVSMYVNRLERRLGTTIFERSRTGTGLTVAGREVLPHLNALVSMHEQVEAACRRIGRAELATLSIASHRLGLLRYLPPALKVMRGLVDGLIVNLTQSYGADTDALVANGDVDIGLGWRDEDDDTRVDVLDEITLASTSSMLFVNEHHRLANAELVTAADLAGEVIITVPSPLAKQDTGRFLEGVAALTWYHTDDVQVALEMVSQGVGVTFLIDLVADLAGASTVGVRIDDPRTYTMTMIRLANTSMSDPAQILWDLLAASIGAVTTDS